MSETSLHSSLKSQTDSKDGYSKNNNRLPNISPRENQMRLPHSRSKSAEYLKPISTRSPATPRRGIYQSHYRNVSTGGDTPFGMNSPSSKPLDLSPPLQSDIVAENSKKRLVDQFFSTLNDNTSKLALASEFTRGPKPSHENSQSPHQDKALSLSDTDIQNLIVNGDFSFVSPKDPVQFDEVFTDYLLNIDSVLNTEKRLDAEDSYVDPLLCLTNSISDTFLTQTRDEIAAAPDHVTLLCQLDLLGAHLDKVHSDSKHLMSELLSKITYLKSSYAKQIKQNVEKLDQLLNNLKSLEERLDLIKSKNSDFKHVLTNDVLEKLAYLESVAETVNKVTQDKRKTLLQNLGLSISFLVVMLAIYLCYRRASSGPC